MLTLENKHCMNHSSVFFFVQAHRLHLHDASVASGRRRGLREHEGRGVLEQLFLHELRGGRLEVLFGAKLALDVAVQVGPS